MSARTALYGGNARSVVERGLRVMRSQTWLVLLSGFFEPVFYLLAMGLGIGALVGPVAGADGQPVEYAVFIAPALLATSAMNGAFYDSTWNVFFKLRFARLYEGMLQTSLGPMDVAIGEIVLALLRGLVYAIGFLGVMLALGLVTSPWAALMIPVALLIATGFASLGMAVTSYLTSFQQMEVVGFALLPMFLFSSTLYPIEVFPTAIQWVIVALPLWHGIELMRDLSVGYLTVASLGHTLYFVVMSVGGVWFTTRRLRALFLR